jgi:hypothetical protein
MSDAKHTRPHLVAVGDPAKEASAAPPTEDRASASESSGRGWLFWLLVVGLIASSAGLVVQTQHAGELQGAIETLEGELFTTRTALDAYEVRFGEVRDSVGSLKTQLEQLSALVSADPLADENRTVSGAGAAASGESGFLVDPTH